MFNPFMNIIKACAGLQLQIFQVNMYSISNSLSGRAMSQSNNTEKGQENIDQAGEWIGGKPQGSLKIDKNKIILKINKKTQKVLISDFPSLTDAEIYSRNLLLSLCKQNGKISNEYRYHFSGSDSFLEVKVGETIIKVDVQSKEIIDKYEWLMNETDKSVYRKEGRVKVKLENELTGQVHEKTIFSKIDGNLFNFRLENLKKLTENDEKGKKCLIFVIKIIMSFFSSFGLKVLLFTSGFGIGSYAYMVDGVKSKLNLKLESDSKALHEVLSQSEAKTRINY